MSSDDKTGGYFWGTGRRKCSTASVRMRPGSGHIVVNDRPLERFFPGENHRNSVTSALRFVKLATAFDVFCNVNGGGVTGQAEAVRILSAEGYQRYGPEASELAAYLALHGINADITTFQPLRGSVGSGLLRAGRLFGCDLLSMGAYSHSRLRQLILGGVTQHVLENSDLPVMMTR